MHTDPHAVDVIDLQEREEAATQAKRDQGLWYVIVGIALLFAGNLSTAFSVGGVLSVLYGVFQYARHAIALARLRDDPWKDQELDAWEEEHYGDGPPSGGESIVESDPDSAWGGKLH